MAEQREPNWQEQSHSFRQALRAAMRNLRAAEDMARLRFHADWPLADRIRFIHEQLTEDVLNGKTNVPSVQQRLDEAEKESARLRGALQEIRDWYPPAVDLLQPFADRALRIADEALGGGGGAGKG